MLLFCLKCRENTECKNPKVVKTKNRRIRLLLKCEVCNSKKSKFIKEQEASRLLSSLGIKTPLSKIPLVGPLLFQKPQQVNARYKMNEIVNKFLLAGDKFMPEMYLRQPGFTYSAQRPFTKNKERIQKFKETGDSRYTHQKELDKACFQHDMAYADFKDLTRRKAFHEIWRNKAFNFAKNPKYDGCQRGLASMIYKFFLKKNLLVVVLKMRISQTKNQLKNYTNQLFKKRKVYSSFIDNIWGADLGHMQLISKFNKGIRFLLCTTDIFSKYAWAIPLKDKKGITSNNTFQKFLEESNRKPNGIWVDKGSEFNNRSMKSGLGKNSQKCIQHIMKKNLLLLRGLLET